MAVDKVPSQSIYKTPLTLSPSYHHVLIAVVVAITMPTTLPVFFFSHGSTAMLQNRTAAAAYWEQVGRQALDQGVERIVMMGAHWETMGEKILVSANPVPPKQPVAWVDPARYVDFDLNPDLELASEVVGLLADAGFDAALEPKFEQIHDTLYVRIF